jgi:hypothetical protein
MWRINSVFLFLLSILLTNESYGTVFWEENFNTPGLGVWGDDDGESLHINLDQGESWSISFEDCSLTAENDYVKTVSTSGGRFEALDCDGEAIWYSPWIDISKFAAVNCELVSRETGSGANPASKYLKAYFQLDDQEDVLFEVNGLNEGNWGEAVASQTQLAGDSLRIVVRLNSSYANDKVILDAVRLWSDQPEVIDPNQLAEAGDVLINEVLFDPYPGGIDFVELYNRSETTIRLDHLHLASRNDDGSFKKLVPLAIQEIFIQPHSYLVLSENHEQVLVFYESRCIDCFLNLDDMPAFNNDRGQVVLLNDSLEILDEMHYTAKMHHSLLLDEEGVSLERISLDEAGMDPSNWASASASVHFATPGYENSMSEGNHATQDQISLEPKSFSPNDDGYNDYLSISYQFENPNYVANLKIFDSHGRPVCDLVNNEPAGSAGEWIWTGEQSDGRKSRLGVYVVLLELHDQNGTVKQYKKACSITDRLE